MRTTLVVLASLAGLAITGAPALAEPDCAQMRVTLSAAVSDVLSAASAQPIVLADLSQKVDAADVALKALNGACGDHAATATMPAATAVTGSTGVTGSAGVTGSGPGRTETPRPSPTEMMERTDRTHVAIVPGPVEHGASAAVVSQRAAALVTDLRGAIGAGDLAGIRKIAETAAN